MGALISRNLHLEMLNGLVLEDDSSLASSSASSRFLWCQTALSACCLSKAYSAAVTLVNFSNYSVATDEIVYFMFYLGKIGFVNSRRLMC